jgi:hypothetical protein
MPPIDFKLSKPFESTRRASFPERPSWPALAGRIGYLYEIPEERVGVSYLDSDGDEITLSSDSELQEYYQNNNSTNGGTIRFTVHDLGPNARRPAPEAAQLRTPLFGGDRGTFGVPANFDVFGTADGDWQTIAGMDEAGPHAFVESVPSEGTASKRASVFSSSTGTDLGRIITPTLWKGKARAIDSDSDQDTSRSVLGTDGPAKPPVHVMATNPFQFIPSPPAVQTAQSEVSATILNTALSRPASTVGAGAPRDTVPNSPQAVTALEAPGSPILAPQSMPTPPAQPKPESPAAAPEARPEATPEPQAAPQNPNTFYTDFATFLTTAATVFSQHPELGEGLRNIIANATNGSYLGANAEQGMQSAQAQLVQGLQQAQVHINQGMERAQEQVVQATAQARGVEGFVQRRVEEAVGGIFNALGATAAAPATPRQQPVQPSTPAGSPPRNEDTRSTRVPMTWSVSRDRNSFQPQSTFGHALNNWMDTVAPPSIQPLQAPQPPVAPQPPLPPQPPRVPQAPRVPPPPVPRSPSWGRGPRAMPPASPITRVASLSRRPGAPASQPAGPRRQSTVGMPAPEVTPVAAPALAPIPAPEPKSAREMLEESKQLYKAAKAAYRAARETRRGRGANLSGDAFVFPIVPITCPLTLLVVVRTQAPRPSASSPTLLLPLRLLLRRPSKTQRCLSPASRAAATRRLSWSALALRTCHAAQTRSLPRPALVRRSSVRRRRLRSRREPSSTRRRTRASSAASLM